MKAVILAAGQGIRLSPLTDTRPKHMIPVGGKPILEHLISSLRFNQIGEIVLVVGYKQDIIKDYFGEGEKFGVRIEYVQQPKPSGTGDALRLASKHLNAENFLTTYGDLYVTPDALKKVLQSGGGENVLATVQVEDPKSYGVVMVDGGKVRGIVEKPEKDVGKLANAGIYVFSPKILEAVEETEPSKRGEVELTDSVKLMLEKGQPFKAIRIEAEEWHDLGKPWDLLEVNQRILKSLRPLFRGEVDSAAKLVGPVQVLHDAHIMGGAYVEGPAIIGEECEVRPHAYIRSYTSLGRDVRIGNSCEIKNSIVMDGSRISHLSYVGDSIIGENCNFGAGTCVANVRLDDKTVKMKVKDEVLDSGRRKLGVVVGDEVKTGLNASLMPGVKVGPNSWIGPNVVVYRDLPPNTFVLQRQDLEHRKIGDEN